MALDILEILDGDLVFVDSVSPKALNVLSVQLGSLEYIPDFGVDFDYFLQSEVEFQNESFKAYLVERLTKHQVNVAKVTESLEALMTRLAFKVGDTNKSEGLIV